MSYRTRIRASACIAIAALLSPIPSFSQEPAAAADSPDAEGLEDVIVTAQRRQESVQRASLSIEAIPMEELATRGVNDALTLNDVVPGLKIATTGGQLQVFVRGVGDVSANAYTQASVSLNVDGVYIARSSAFSSTFFDTARVEVLRGPQGTLYGRNTSGGAINILSNGPELGESNGYLVAEAGNYSLYRAQGAYGASLSDTFAFRIAGQVVRRDGYLSDGSNDDRSDAVRLRTLWEPNDALSIGFTAEVAQVGGNGPGRVYRPALFGDPWTGPQDPRITPALFPALRVRNDNSIDTDSLALTGEINWTFGGGTTLTVIPAYRDLDVRSNVGVDLIFDESDESTQTSLEARLAGEGSSLSWVLGAFSFAEDLSVFVRNDQRTAANLSGALQFQEIPVFDTDAWAVFGEGRYSFSDRFRLVAGLRYTEEERKRNGQLRNQTFTNGVLTRTTLLPLLNASRVDAVTWRGGFELDVAERSMAYATVSTGFKSGGFDATGIGPFDPEYVTAYTLGLKNRLVDNTLQLNLEAFYWKYKDQQIAFLGIDSTGTTSFITRNAGQSRIYGGNVDVVWRPTASDTLDFGVEYLSTNYSDFRYNTVGSFAAGTLLADGCFSDGPTPGAPGQFIQNCSDQPLPRAPKLSGNLRYSHEFALGNGGSVVAGGVFKYQSRSYLGLNYLSPFFRQEAFQTGDLDLTYNAPEGKWSLQAYVRNVSDKAVYLTASTQASIPPTTGFTRGSVDAIGPPRTFGARFQINF